MQKLIHNIRRRHFVAFFSCLLIVSLHGAQLEVGSPFPEISGQDQHEQSIQVTKDTRHIVITFSMSVGKKANKYFAAKGADFLNETHAVLVNDILGMPAVGRVFALPKMRKYPHRIFLADAEGLLDPFPSKDGYATVFDLDDELRIVAMRFWDPADGSDPY
jgi:hypothetical protein